MNRNLVLHHGTQMRDNVLTIYRAYPTQDASEIVRRLVFEIGEAVSDLHGRKVAGQLLYAAADACTAKLPIEDFRLPAVAAPPSPTPASAPAAADKSWKELNWAGKSGRALGKLAALILDRFPLGFAAGLIVGRTPQ